MKKKPLMALGMLTVVGVVGATFAYFTDTAVFENVFKTKKFTTTVTEEFESPEDWRPGTTTDKKVTIENTGAIDLVTRVKVDEKWSTDAPLTLEDGSAAVEMNFPEDFYTNWQESGDYYYYDGVLNPGDKVDFLDSVTFNKDAGEEYSCETSTEGNKTTKTCTPTYSDATYTLTITVESLQADAEEEVWGDWRR